MDKHEHPSIVADQAFYIAFEPSPEYINALPIKVREYIHALQTRCDPAGDVAALVIAEYKVRALSLLLHEADAGAVAVDREKLRGVLERHRYLKTARG